MDEIKVPRDFLISLMYSLDEMREYANDGSLDRRDPDFEEFFEAVDNAEQLSQELYNKYIERSE